MNFKHLCYFLMNFNQSEIIVFWNLMTYYNLIVIWGIVDI